MQKRLLTNGNIFKRTDNRWGGVVWYMNEVGERKRKSFSGTTKAEVNKKITKYISKFNKEISENNESNKRLKDSMYNYLKVFKYPSVERVSYDRLEQLLNNQIAPYIGDNIISDITAVDIKTLINTLTEKGYAFSTVKKTYNLLNEYFRYLEQEEILFKNPMRSVGVIKKANFYANQGKEVLPASESEPLKFSFDVPSSALVSALLSAPSELEPHPVNAAVIIVAAVAKTKSFFIRFFILISSSFQYYTAHYSNFIK